MIESIQVIENKMLSAEKGLFYLWDIYTNLAVTTKHKSRAEILNIKKRIMRERWQKTTKPKWQTESQEKRNTGDRAPENKT